LGRLFFYAIRPQATLGVFGDQPLAMVLFHEAGARVDIDPFVVAATFGLTPAEARVGVELTRGLSPEEIAQTHGVAISTVRSQLRSLFQKTRTTRQTELVSTIASLPMLGLGSDNRY
jgi:DNA-binding CsgD family transcriptional regulator